MSQIIKAARDLDRGDQMFVTAPNGETVLFTIDAVRAGGYPALIHDIFGSYTLDGVEHRTGFTGRPSKLFTLVSEAAK